MLKVLTSTLALAMATATPAVAGEPRSTLQRDADAIRAVGITGVQARSTRPGGRSESATSGVSDLTTGRPVSPRGYFRIGSTNKAIVAAAMRHAPEFQPGQGWRYSNTGYAVAGLVIEAVTGRPWYDEVERRIIRPLGLRHTFWPGTDPRLPNPHANGYTRFAAELIDTTELVDADASGGYISTLADLDTFQRALFDGRLLRKPLLDQMRRSVEVDEPTRQVWPGARYGLGMFSRPLACGITAWIPGGDQLGYRTRAAITSDGRQSAVVSMSTQLFDSRDAMIEQESLPQMVIIRHK